MSDENTNSYPASKQKPFDFESTDPHRPNLAELKEVTRQTSLNEHVDNDLKLMHSYLEGIHYGLTKTRRIDDLCKLVTLGIHAIEKRRQFALRPTHAADHKNPKAFGFEHID